MRVVRITASAPTRIDLAGGTLDIWPLYLFHDGAETINAAITIRAHCEVTRLGRPGVAMRSEDTGTATEVAKSALLGTDGDFRLVARIARFFQVDDVMIVTRSESPVGAGIAGSSALNVALSGALNRWSGANLDGEALLAVAMNVEAQAIEVPTGAQDYRPALYGGISVVELGVAGIRRRELRTEPAELERRLVLAYTQASRNSGINNWEVTKGHIDGDRAIFDRFERIRDIAHAMRAALEAGDWAEVGCQLAAEWEARKALAPGVTTPAIDDLMARARVAGARAGKVCGAGGGGCLVCFADPDRVTAVRAALSAGGARVMDFRIDMAGLTIDVEE
jgi:D-glycero-alpha-D-manno-heptose-7-phosphate kinase